MPISNKMKLENRYYFGFTVRWMAGDHERNAKAKFECKCKFGLLAARIRFISSYFVVGGFIHDWMEQGNMNLGSREFNL